MLPISNIGIQAYRDLQHLRHVTHPNDYPDDWLMTLDKSCHSKADAQDDEFKLHPTEE